MATLEKIRDLIAAKFELSATELESGISLDKLGIDSLAITEFMFDLEKEFKINVPYAPVEIETLEDIVAVVDRLVDEQHGKAE
jgi:acyl carrier protein